ncbi:transcription factor bHLH96-like [Solanum dulcamara]|uniref:transcription factor bHLH96-like n=1 Tax=Solanum dulcamara TaxID=45834 RepID=UPI002485C686|nr:transcription factor bHLH96-like [Solanum dulcamara]
MALETVVCPQEQYNGYVCKEFYGYGEQESSFLGNNWEYPSSCNYSTMQNQVIGDCNIVGESNNNQLILEGSSANSNSSRCSTRKRKRTCNNKNQRMIHIAVERNRRKQMNEYLNLLRSLMPSSYVQKADQASIIGGAINFVKELEHNLQTLQAQKTLISHLKKRDISSFFSFLQHSNYSCESSAAEISRPRTMTHDIQVNLVESHVKKRDISSFFSFLRHSNYSCESSAAEISRPRTMTHDIQVNLVESHVNLKILSKRRSKQLMNIVVGLQCLWLTILHLNVTVVHDQMVLYSISAKLEGCQLTTVEEISQAVNQLLGRIQEEEATLN